MCTKMKYFDRWSFIHFGYGAMVSTLFFHLLGWWVVLLVFCTEVLWELFESSQCGIAMMNACGDTLYKGDLPLHSLVDVIITTLGGVLSASILFATDSSPVALVTCGIITALSYATYFYMRYEGIGNPQER